jgi:hypothetical protein
MSKIDCRQHVEEHLAAAWQEAARINPMLLASLDSKALDRLRGEIEQDLDRGVSADQLRHEIINRLFAVASSSQQAHSHEAKPSRE